MIEQERQLTESQMITVEFHKQRQMSSNGKYSYSYRIKYDGMDHNRLRLVGA